MKNERHVLYIENGWMEEITPDLADRIKNTYNASGLRAKRLPGGSFLAGGRIIGIRTVDDATYRQLMKSVQFQALPDTDPVDDSVFKPLGPPTVDKASDLPESVPQESPATDSVATAAAKTVGSQVPPASKKTGK